MKRLFTFVFANCLFMIMTNASVKGFAYLNSQTNHAGIKVKFLPQSGTAVLDSTVTATDGSYNIALSGGLYKVLFTKQGYQDLFYQNSNSIAIASNDSIQSVTLLPGNIKFIAGNVSGTWSPDTIYVVTDTIRILSGNTLNIPAGITVRFIDNYKFVVKGTLNAVGTDSQSILFTSNNSNPVPGSWVGLEGTANSIINIKNCLFEYAFECIHSENGVMDVANSEFRYFKNVGVYSLGGSPQIMNNYFHSYRIGGELWTLGVFITGNSLNALVSCNVFDDGRGYGIKIDGGGVIQNNTIQNINVSDRGNGIYVGNNSHAFILNNYITNCQHGIRTGENVTPHPNATIANNTITNCSEHGIWFCDFYSQGKVINNIFVNNPIAIAGTTNSAPDVVSNNIFWNNIQNFNGLNIAGIGQLVNTNVNGDAIDSYFNLFQSPEFVSGNEPNLTGSSPCINAGDTAYNRNMGFYPDYVCDTVIISAVSELGLQGSMMFPNPATDNVTIEIDNSSSSINELKVTDFTGATLLKKSINKSTNIDIKEFSDGLYLVSISNGTKISSLKLVVVH